MNLCFLIKHVHSSHRELGGNGSDLPDLGLATDGPAVIVQPLMVHVDISLGQGWREHHLGAPPRSTESTLEEWGKGYRMLCALGIG